MHIVDVDTAEQYLRDTQRIAPDESIEVRELAGGVSNIVLLVARHGGEDFVLKQARPQLRVPQPWFCSVERIWREVDVLHVCDRVLSADENDSSAVIRTPRVVFEDRENYLFAMTAAPPHVVWKQQLLAGDVNPQVARACGHLLGTLHAGTWRDPAIAASLGDRQFFDDLRVDPYYRQIAIVHDDLRVKIQRLIDSVFAYPLALVHGDFSPKNLLVYEGGLMLVDFEVGHYGDPAFDLGFFLSHLILKTFYAAPAWQPYVALTEAFWAAYNQRMVATVIAAEMQSLVARAVQNFAGCTLARVDGKSRVEYLQSDTLRNSVRDLCRALFINPPATWDGVLSETRLRLNAL
jgi:5-methylthioribose kinase